MPQTRQSARSEMVYLMTCHPLTLHSLLEMPLVASHESSGTSELFRQIFPVLRRWLQKVRRWPHRQNPA